MSWDTTEDGRCDVTVYLWVLFKSLAYLTIIASDNGLPPSRRQAIIWTNAGILLIRHQETNFSEILIEIHTFSFKKMYLKISSAKRRPFWLGLNVLNMYTGVLLIFNNYRQISLRAAFANYWYKTDNLQVKLAFAYYVNQQKLSYTYITA